MNYPQQPPPPQYPPQPGMPAYAPPMQPQYAPPAQYPPQAPAPGYGPPPVQAPPMQYPPAPQYPPQAPAYPPQQHPGQMQPPGYGAPPAGVPGQYVPRPTQAPNQGSLVGSIFAGVDEAKASFDGGNYIVPCRFVARINRMKAAVNKDSEPYFANEMLVVHVLDTSESVKAGKAPHRAGDEVTDMKMKKHPSFWGNVKSMVAAIEGTSAEGLMQQLQASGRTLLQHCDEMVSDAQPYAGMFVEINARQIPTKKQRAVLMPDGTTTLQPGIFTKVGYMRAVPAAEVKQMIPPDAAARLFPKGELDQAIAVEAQIERVATTPAPAASRVVPMADGRNYIVPPGVEPHPQYPGYGYDAAKNWVQLTAAN